jgi:hypothetical protein
MFGFNYPFIWHCISEEGNQHITAEPPAYLSKVAQWFS